MKHIYSLLASLSLATCPLAVNAYDFAATAEVDLTTHSYPINVNEEWDVWWEGGVDFNGIFPMGSTTKLCFQMQVSGTYSGSDPFGPEFERYIALRSDPAGTGGRTTNGFYTWKNSDPWYCVNTGGDTERYLETGELGVTFSKKGLPDGIENHQVNKILVGVVSTNFIPNEPSEPTLGCGDKEVIVGAKEHSVSPRNPDGDFLTCQVDPEIYYSLQITDKGAHHTETAKENNVSVMYVMPDGERKSSTINEYEKTFIQTDGEVNFYFAGDYPESHGYTTVEMKRVNLD